MTRTVRVTAENLDQKKRETKSSFFSLRLKIQHDTKR